MASGSISKNHLAETSLQRIRENGHLNAFTFVASKKDLKSQTLKDGSGPCRPLEGVPIAIKDNFCVKHMPTTCGSKMLHNFVPPYTATVVQKLVNAGAVIVGKTNMDEYGMGFGVFQFLSFSQSFLRIHNKIYAIFSKCLPGMALSTPCSDPRRIFGA